MQAYIEIKSHQSRLLQLQDVDRRHSRQATSAADTASEPFIPINCRCLHSSSF